MLKFCSQCLSLFNVLAITKSGRKGRKPNRCVKCSEKVTAAEFYRWTEFWELRNIPELGEKARLRKAKWNNKNRGLRRIYALKAEAKRKLRCVTWGLGDPRIKGLYEEASLAGMQVDHIIPLCGELVSGLHVFENLQLLPKHVNCSKGNKFVPN